MPENVSNGAAPTVYPAPEMEGVESRYDREYGQMGKVTVPESNSIPDDRADRQLHQQDEERSSRRFVDRDSGTSATGHDSDQKDKLVAAANENRSNTSIMSVVTPADQGE